MLLQPLIAGQSIPIPHSWTILALKMRKWFPFESLFFLTFPLQFYLYNKFKLSVKDYLLLIYTFMCLIIFLRIIILSFQSHQSIPGLRMAWNRDGLSCIALSNSLYLFFDLKTMISWISLVWVFVAFPKNQVVIQRYS